MAGLLDAAKDYAQTHRSSLATGLIIALPGAYLMIGGKSIPCAVGFCSNIPSPSQCAITRPTEGLSVYQTPYPLDQRLNLPVSKWSDEPAPTFIFQVIEGTRKNINTFLIATGERLGLDVYQVLQNLDDRWAREFPLSRFGLVAAATALPGSFLIFIRNHPDSWAAKHQNQVANALHVLALVTVANQRISVQDLLVTALVMVSFETFQRYLGSVSAEPCEEPSAIETLLAQTHSTIGESDIKAPLPDTVNSIPEKSPLLSRSNSLTVKDEEILRLQQSLTEARTSEKIKEIEMKRTQADLCNARDTLNETFVEYTSLRNEMKTMKQTVGRDHQTIIYRKDIELFALRKGNEQKEDCIKDKDAKLKEILRVHEATLTLKDSQLQNLKERIAFLENKESNCNIDSEVKSVSQVEGDHQAVQVKLLRVKGRKSLEVERVAEEKDAEISKLKGDLADAAKASETLAKKQDELRRAWDATHEVQNTLNEEQQMHAETREKLQEVSTRLDDEVKRHRERGSLTRLPTIEEQDKKELETMFNAAQEDNLRLYAELDVHDKRLREANARIFVLDQEVNQLREQLRLERAINEDMETARPSLVHRVHFQRMEGQLKESRDALSDKDDEILLLKEDIAAKDKDIEDLQKAKQDVLNDRSVLQTEREELKRTIHSLETTKEQLMLDHERLAAHRSRQRTTSADHASARSSGATLTDRNVSPQVITNDAEEEPLPPARPVTMADMGKMAGVLNSGSIQNTPSSTYRSPLAAPDKRLSMISDKAPPKELRGVHSKRQSLKGFMRKVVGKDPEGEKKDKMSARKGKETAKGKEMAQTQARLQTALAPKPKATSALVPKDKNTLMRPKTAGASGLRVDTGVGNVNGKEIEVLRPTTAGPFPIPRRVTPSPTSGVKATTRQTSTPTRYYAALEHQPKEDNIDSGVDVGVDASSPRPKSSGWSTS
jgi:hypothetical protein